MEGNKERRQATLLVEMYIGAAPVENGRQVPRKTKTTATMWFSDPPPRHVSGENHGLKGCLLPDVHCSTVHSSQDMEATWMPISGGGGKEDTEIRYGSIVRVCAQLLSRVWLCNYMHCSPPDSSVQGIVWARILEGVSISFSRESSWPRDQSGISCIGMWVLH